MHKFKSQPVLERFMEFPKDKRKYLFELREMIFDVAKTDTRIGQISEELRWGDPSYITASSNSGSALRIGLFGESKVALYFHCKTMLVERFKEQYFDTLEYSKNRAILIAPQSPPKDEILRNCIYASLVYKLQSKGKLRA